MNRVRRLLDPATGKTWSTRCDGELVIVSNFEHPEIPTAGTVEPLG